MVAEKNESHEFFAGEVRAELGRHRITISQLADEINRTRTTVNLWLLRDVTQERYDMMIAGIKRIIEREGKR